MLTVGQQKLDGLTLAALAVVAAGLTALSVVVPGMAVWGFLGLAGLAILVYWALRGEVTIWAWLWVLSYGLLDWPEWRIVITGFFNLTVPRFVFLGAVLVFAVHFLTHRGGVRFDRGVLWAMLLLTGYTAVNASFAGWTAHTKGVESFPYFRFLEAMLFPFIIFFLVYNATRDEDQIRKALLLLSGFGWFVLYIGYLQFAAIRGAVGARQFIWPPYVNDPTFGIHFDRARGPFGSGSQQAVYLIVLFYSNLFLLRRLRGAYRAALVLQLVLIPPAIFFTGMRSAYLAFALCGILWCLVAARRRLGAAKLAFSAVAIGVFLLAFRANLAQTERQTGGLAQRGPIEARQVLLQQTWQILREHPLAGVGFGHFADAQNQLARDPASLGALSTGLLVEHNLFLGMAAETGILGFAGLVAVFVLIWRQSRQLYRKLPPTAEGFLGREFVVLFWVVLINYLTDAMFRDTFIDAFANSLFWTFAGLVAGFNRLLEPHPLEGPAVGEVVRA